MNNNAICPIYFEDHSFGGFVNQIENFTNINFGTVRTTVINGKPYFASVDICRGLCITDKHSGDYVSNAVSKILRNNYDVNENDLYFYLNIETQHSNGRGAIVKQMVRMLFISQPIVYMLIFRSQKAEAEGFKAWLAYDVLPKLGYIGRDRVTQILDNESESINNTLKCINEKYDSLENDINNNTNMTVNNMGNYMTNYQQAKFNELNAKIDTIGCIVDDIIENERILNTKVNAIASGLNSIFTSRR